MDRALLEHARGFLVGRPEPLVTHLVAATVEDGPRE
jgi:hypothetical protein